MNAPTVDDLTSDILSRNALIALTADIDAFDLIVRPDIDAAIDALRDRFPALAITFLHRAGSLPPSAAHAYATLYLAGYRATR